MIKFAKIEDAEREVVKWQGDPSSIQHLGDRGNSVFSFLNSAGQPQILRFTDPDFRSYDEVAAELGFVSRLKAADVSVARALPDRDGQLLSRSRCSSGELICSSIEFAQGLEVQIGSSHWNVEFFHEWGRNLAQIHRASSLFNSEGPPEKRWQWDEEILIARAEHLIPVDDTKSREEFREVLDRCRSLPRETSNFGLIHADHAPQNFRYEPNQSRVTAFDFGNCCYHWFLSDLAISLSTIRRKENREVIKDGILDGYSTVRTLPNGYEDLLDLFIRLRVVYVYLSRLHLWAVDRTSEQQAELVALKSLVHAKAGWNLPDQARET
ncbi:MAG: phosphotransferase [Bdellovibrionota bacterium]